jgi:hypothetical protein
LQGGETRVSGCGGMTRMFRRLLIGLTGLLIFAALASFALWWWTERQLAQGFAAWQQMVATNGWTVQAGSSARGGWPFGADLSLEQVSLAAAPGTVPGGAAYTAAQVKLRLDPLHPTVLYVFGEGTQSLRLSASPVVPFTAEKLRLSIPLAPDTPAASATLDGSNLRFAAPADGLTVGLLQGEANFALPRAINFRLSAEAITLPPPPAPQSPLGSHIASATAEGTLTGMLPPDAASPAAAAAAWRDSGGALTLHRIALGWGPLGVTGSASFKLDAALQPDVAANLRLVGIDESLTALSDAHAITPHAAQAAKAVAGLLAQAPAGGGTPGVEVPVTLRDGTVSLGMIPLATVRKLSWPAGP